MLRVGVGVALERLPDVVEAVGYMFVVAGGFAFFDLFSIVMIVSCGAAVTSGEIRFADHVLCMFLGALASYVGSVPWIRRSFMRRTDWKGGERQKGRKNERETYEAVELVDESQTDDFGTQGWMLHDAETV